MENHVIYWVSWFKRWGKQHHPTSKTQLHMEKKVNQKPYNKFIINLVSLVWRKAFALASSSLRQ